MLDDSEIYIKELSHTIINLYKLVIEDMGYDMGYTNNEIEYRNYLVNDPLYVYGKSINQNPYIDTQVESGESDRENSKAVDLSGNNEYNDIKGFSIDGVFIPESVKKNQNFKGKKPPKEFIDGVTRASKETGIPVAFYIAFGALESTWTNITGKTYQGYFGQRASEGGVGTVYQQAKGQALLRIYKEAKKDADKYGITDSLDMAVWCYLCHNAGNAGGRTMLKTLNGNLRHDNIRDYQLAAQAFVDKYGHRWSEANKISQVKEKTMSIPKAYYILYQLLS